MQARARTGNGAGNLLRCRTTFNRATLVNGQGAGWHLLIKMGGGHISREVTKTEAPMKYFTEKT